MSLLDTFLMILSDWRNVFPTKPSYKRATIFAISSLCVFGRACITRMICFLGLEQKDWSAFYRLLARCQWLTQSLFQGIVQYAVPIIDEPYIAVAFDDTRLKKTGKKIKTASYHRDPLSPPFHLNFLYGLRFLQASLLIPLYLKTDHPPRSVPILFQEVPPLKKPGKRATKEEVGEYKKKQKLHNLSVAFKKALADVRTSLDIAGAYDKPLIVSVDGSFCNQTCMKNLVERTCIVARARKDAKLCFRDKGPKKFYSDKKFTPEEIRKDKAIRWMKAKIYHGGAWRTIRYKEIKEVLWQKGTGKNPLRLIVLASTPYRLTKAGRVYYRQPAYLLCQASQISTKVLIQKYFDRWQIEVNHREEKDTLGIGQAQVWSEHSVARQPAFAVAAYSALLLAGVLCFEDKRGGYFETLPKWRRNSRRPSCLDLVQLLRREVSSTEQGILRTSLAESVLKSAA